MTTTISTTGFIHATEREEVRIEAWGSRAVRVRARRPEAIDDIPGAELLTHAVAPSLLEVDGERAVLEHAGLRVELSSDGRLTFQQQGCEVLADVPFGCGWCPPRRFYPNGEQGARVEQRFAARDGERFFGLGQQPHGHLDQRGLTVELRQGNATVSIPVVISSMGYGLVWNNPAVGRVHLGRDEYLWEADHGEVIDYFVIAGPTPADVLAGYAETFGLPSAMPDWALGLWQSKLRYRTQDELMAVADEYQRRGLPISVIVNDFFHWRAMGDWCVDQDAWPDLPGMVRELEGRGVKLMVSVWPTLEPTGRHHERFAREGLMVTTKDGTPFTQHWPTRAGMAPCSYVDPTNPAARAALWQALDEGYHRHGIELFWLDACEPDMAAERMPETHYAAGPWSRVGNRYPLDHARGVHEGLLASGVAEPVSLVRSAWLGSQRFGAAMWSGDIPTTFASLRAQIRAGLNVAMSGMPWWTTDIGGFQGGDPDSADYRELMMRWFEYGTFCPLFRIHGDRQPNMPFSVEMTGGPNEVWSYGEQAHEVMAFHIRLREVLRPYVAEQGRVAERAGLPPMRPLFVDFPDQQRAWAVEDEFMLGPDILVAPVDELGARSRSVWLPDGVDWTNLWTGELLAGGDVVVDAPVERVPVFVRGGSAIGADLARFVGAS